MKKKKNSREFSRNENLAGLWYQMMAEQGEGDENGDKKVMAEPGYGDENFIENGEENIIEHGDENVGENYPQPRR